MQSASSPRPPLCRDTVLPVGRKPSLRNTRPDMVPGLQQELMEGLAMKMKVSGHPEEFRAGVISSAVIGYERLVAACERGEKKSP